MVLGTSLLLWQGNFQNVLLFPSLRTLDTCILFLIYRYSIRDERIEFMCNILGSFQNIRLDFFVEKKTSYANLISIKAFK